MIDSYKSYFSYKCDKCEAIIVERTPDGKYAWLASVGSKGQIVIPKEVRGMLGIGSGDVLLALGDEDRGFAMPAKDTISKITDTYFNTTVKESE